MALKRYNTLLEGGAMKGSCSVPFVDRPPVERNKLGPFVRGYINCMLWTEELDALYDVGDLTERNIQQVVRDCVGFYWRHRDLFETIWADPFDTYDQSDAGHDFWLSRNGHGAGYFDKAQSQYKPKGKFDFYLGATDPFDILQHSAGGQGEYHIWVNDDPFDDENYGKVDAEFTESYAGGRAK